MKKLLLGLGAAASVIAPIAAVVACGDDAKTIKTTGEHHAHVAFATTSDFVVLATKGGSLHFWKAGSTSMSSGSGKFVITPITKIAVGDAIKFKQVRKEVTTDPKTNVAETHVTTSDGDKAISLKVIQATVNDLILGDDSNQTIVHLSAKTQAGFNAVTASLKGYIGYNMKTADKTDETKVVAFFEEAGLEKNLALFAAKAALK